MKYLVGIDIGTSGTKSVLFDTEGNAIKSSLAEYEMLQPQNGWAEERPLDWWEAVCKTLKEITKAASDGEICGIGFSGQMHSLVLLDENCDVIRNSILWCDGRTTEECREIESLLGREKLIEITANPALEGFTVSKIRRVQKHEKQNYARCRHILLAKDYIRYKLTGEFATEVSDASGMQLLDVKNRCWSEEVCRALDINTEFLPKVYESPEVTGYVSHEASSLTGLPEGLPVAGGAGDNAAAAVGMGVCTDGKAFTTVGKSGVVCAHTDKPIIDKQGRIHTFCCAVPGKWHVMGVTQAACLSLNWFKNTLAKEFGYDELDTLCENIPIGAEKLIFLPYLMGERTPLLDANARGVFFGLSNMHTKTHMARAVMEGVAYSLKSCLDVLNENGITPGEMAICGGGAKSEFWRQMIADIYEMPVNTMLSGEGAALGAAILAGCAAGIYKSVEEGCAKCVKIKKQNLNRDENTKEYGRFYGLYKEMYPQLKEQFAKLKDLG